MICRDIIHYVVILIDCENDWICDICSVLCSVHTRSGITACTSRRSSTLSLFPPPLTSSSPPPTTEPSVYGTFVESRRTVPPPSSLTKHQPLLIQVCMLSVESLHAAQCRMVCVWCHLPYMSGVVLCWSCVCDVTAHLHTSLTVMESSCVACYMGSGCHHPFSALGVCLCGRSSCYDLAEFASIHF